MKCKLFDIYATQYFLTSIICNGTPHGAIGAQHAGALGAQFGGQRSFVWDHLCAFVSANEPSFLDSEQEHELLKCEKPDATEFRRLGGWISLPTLIRGWWNSCRWDNWPRHFTP